MTQRVFLNQSSFLQDEWLHNLTPMETILFLICELEIILGN